MDLALARLVEGHADALRIIDQAGCSPAAGVYGVWASRSAGTGVRAEDASTAAGNSAGELRFASGIGLIDRALVPGWVDEDHHLLFDIDASAAVADESTWRTAAMDASRSFTVVLDVDGGEPVGPTDFYLQRPGFVVGGLCVAAVWAGRPPAGRGPGDRRASGPSPRPPTSCGASARWSRRSGRPSSPYAPPSTPSPRAAARVGA